MGGTVTGAFAYSPGDGFQGSVSLNGTSINAPGSPAVRLEDARLVLDGQRVKMPEAAIAIGESEKATLQFDYDLVTQALRLEVGDRRHEHSSASVGGWAIARPGQARLRR